jgi:hypothetical protein
LAVNENNNTQLANQQAANTQPEVKIAAADGSLKMSEIPEVSRDPYDIDFKTLRTKYMDDKTKKISFSKPSFIHYCKNPYTYAPKYGGDDTILTMELIKAPNGLNYKSLVKPPPKKRTKKKAVEPEPVENAGQEAEQEAEPDAE